MQTWFTFQRCLESLKKTFWSQLAPKVHLRRKVKYWKCRFLSALHFPEIKGSRFETSRLLRFSVKSLILLWNIYDFLKLLVPICDFLSKNIHFHKILVEIQTMWFSFETDDFLKSLAQIFDFPLENKWFCCFCFCVCFC